MLPPLQGWRQGFQTRGLRKSKRLLRRLPACGGWLPFRLGFECFGFGLMVLLEKNRIAFGMLLFVLRFENAREGGGALSCK